MRIHQEPWIKSFLSNHSFFFQKIASTSELGCPVQHISQKDGRPDERLEIIAKTSQKKDPIPAEERLIFGGFTIPHFGTSKLTTTRETDIPTTLPTEISTTQRHTTRQTTLATMKVNHTTIRNTIGTTGSNHFHHGRPTENGGEGYYDGYPQNITNIEFTTSFKDLTKFQEFNQVNPFFQFPSAQSFQSLPVNNAHNYLSDHHPQHHYEEKNNQIPYAYNYDGFKPNFFYNFWITIFKGLQNVWSLLWIYEGPLNN